MISIENNHKLSHPFYKLMELPEDELRTLIVRLSREEIITWLTWNDHNGIYTDEHSLDELGSVLSREEGEKIMLRQILENR